MLTQKEARTVERTIQAEPAEVFHAFTSPAALRIWLCDTAQIEPRTGGRIYLAWNNGDYNSGRFTDSGRARDWRSRGKGPETQPRARYAQPRCRSGGTTVTVTQEGAETGRSEDTELFWRQPGEPAIALESGVDLR